jgi:hypothetical protein
MAQTAVTRTPILFIPLLINLYLCSMARGAVDQGEAALIEEVRAKLPPALAAMERFFGTVHGRSTNRVTIPLGESRTRTIENRRDFAFDGPQWKVRCRFIDSSPERKSSRDQVYCQNPQYGFMLERSDEAKPYSLKVYVPDDSSSEMDRERESYLPVLAPSCYLYPHRLLDLIGRPDFRYTKAAEVDEDGQRLIRVEFALSAKDAPVHSATLFIRPDLGWAVVRSEYFLSPGQKRPFVTTAEYGRSIDGIPIATKVTSRGVTDHSPSKDYELHELSPGPTPASEFTLSAFGLPEMGTTGASSYQDRTIYWLLGAAALFLVLAVAAKRLGDRRGAAQTA